MRLDTLALAAIVIFAVLWLVTAVTGLMVAVPFGVLGLIPIALVIGFLAVVIYQRVTNAEDNHYDKNVDR
jgi:predicted membrane chloride channel (bestrophin family)